MNDGCLLYIVDRMMMTTVRSIIAMVPGLSVFCLLFGFLLQCVVYVYLSAVAAYRISFSFCLVHTRIFCISYFITEVHSPMHVHVHVSALLVSPRSISELVTR